MESTVEQSVLSLFVLWVALASVRQLVRSGRPTPARVTATA